MSDAILFPGQGAQFEGMGKDWCEAFPVARETFAEADEVLGLSLTKLCWESGDEVNRTDVAQPGIFTTSVAVIRVLESKGLDRSSIPLTAGLSLGEYSALWCADALSFKDGLSLVRLRGEAMQAASEACESGMLSLMGANEEQAFALAEVGQAVGICQVANLNAPGQIVLSGEFPALDAVAAAAKEHGVRRTRRLVVAGGFHSECMRPAADALAAALGDVDIQAPKVPVVSNVTARPVGDPAEIRDLLAKQVCSPVLWEKSVRWAAEQGVTRFLEPGPGEILAGILRKIDPELQVTSAARPGDLSA